MILFRLKLLSVLAIVVLVSGCKEVLYSELTEVDANEMVAVLAAENVIASRARNKDGVYEVLVKAQEVAIATVILKGSGLPRKNFVSLGDVFSSSGIIGTPFEQHARYIHAMNQELSQTMTEIEGIESARVSVNAPLQSRTNREVSASTASVTLNYEPDFDIESNISKIKQIISHSLPNLPYDNVAVVFFPANNLTVYDPSETSIAGNTPAVTTAGVIPLGVPKSFETNTEHLGLIALFCITLFGFLWATLALMKPVGVSKEVRSRVDLTGRV